MRGGAAPHASARRGPCRGPRAFGGTSTGVTSAHPAAGPLPLVSGSCCHPRPGHGVAREQFSLRRSQPCLSRPATLTFSSLGSRPGEGTEGTGGLPQGRRSCSRPSFPRPRTPGCARTSALPALTPRLGTGCREQTDLLWELPLPAAAPAPSCPCLGRPHLPDRPRR